MDAFVVVDRETYIKLTWYTPAEKIAYVPENQYELTEKDMKTIELFDSALKKLVKEKWNSFKNTEKKVLREVYSLDKYKYDFKRKAVFHELLIRLFTIDKI